MQKNHVALLMAGTLDSIGSSDVGNDFTSLGLPAYLPQNDNGRVARSMLDDKKYDNERAVGMAEIHQAKPKTTIARLGMMHDTTDFLSMCVNKINETSILWDVKAMQIANADVIFRQIAYNMLLFVNEQAWEDWVDKCVQPMPNLHWQLYSILESAWTHCVDFATDHHNVNVVDLKRPLADLNFDSLLSAVRVYKIFKDNYNNLIAMKAPCSAIPRITPSSSIPRSAASATKKRSTIQFDTASDNEDEVVVVEKKSTPKEKEVKKKKRRLQPDNELRDNTELGIFFCKEINLPVSKLFPQGLAKAPCAGFTFIGKECCITNTGEKCKWPHPRNPIEMKRDDVISIGDFFLNLEKDGSTSVHSTSFLTCLKSTRASSVIHAAQHVRRPSESFIFIFISDYRV